MKIESIERKKILDEALNYAKNVTVDYTTKEGCNEYITNVIDKFKEAKKGIDELAENVTYKLENIEELLTTDNVGNMFEVGDELEFELLTGEPVTIVCIGKNHDKLKNGEKATLTFAFKKCLDGEFEIDPSGKNECGWKNCKMRTVYLPRIFKLLPKVIQDLIVPVEKIANNGKDKKETVLDKLFLLSVREYTGIDEDSLKGEGEQYEYFAKGNKFLNEYWWTRSPTLIAVVIGTMLAILVTSIIAMSTILILSAPASASVKIASVLTLAMLYAVRTRKCLQHGLYRWHEAIIEAGYHS